MRFLISILGCNRVELTKRCIEALDRAGGSFALHLTDNGSSDGTAKYFAELCQGHHWIRVVSNEANLGFMAPNNSAFEYAKEAGFDVMICLNNDVVVPRGWLQRIEAEFQRHPAAALVGAKHTCCTVHDNLHGYEGPRIEYIDGAVLAVHVERVSRHFPYLFAPYLDFIYSEDLDLSLRMQRLGYTIHQANFTVEHVRQSTCKDIPKTRDSQERNHAVMKEKWRHWLRHRTFRHRIIVRRWFSLGDVILTTPVIRRLWQDNPLSPILVETNFPDVFRGNPCVEHASQSIPRQPTDLVVDLDNSYENAPMRHFITSYARTAGIAGDVPHRTELYWDEADEALVELPDPFNSMFRGWVAIHPGPTTWKGKNWPIRAFAELADGLRRDGWAVALIGLETTAKGIPCDLDARGKTNTVNQLAALLSRCQLAVCVDSGPMHCALAVGCPTVGIFGVTQSRFIMHGERYVGVDADPTIWPMAGERHRVIGQTHVEEDGQTIASITVDQVREAIQQVLQEAPTPSRATLVKQVIEKMENEPLAKFYRELGSTK